MQSTQTITKTLLVGNLHPTLEPGVLRRVFEGIGPVLSLDLLNDGFAFVAMNADHAAQARRRLHGTRLSGELMLIDEGF